YQVVDKQLLVDCVAMDQHRGELKGKARRNLSCQQRLHRIGGPVVGAQSFVRAALIGLVLCAGQQGEREREGLGSRGLPQEFVFQVAIIAFVEAAPTHAVAQTIGDTVFKTQPDGRSIQAPEVIRTAIERSETVWDNEFQRTAGFCLYGMTVDEPCTLE